jgi:type II secretory pathway component PulC
VRRRWILELLHVAGCLAVLGLGASALTVTLGATLISDARASGFDEENGLDEEDALDEEVDEPEGPAAPIARTRAPVALAWNPFCPTCSPHVPETPDPPLLAGATETFEGARPTQLPITLNATLEAPTLEGSLAVIQDGERGTIGPYAIGDTLRPGVRLDSIGPGSILLSNNGVTEYALVGAAPPPPKPPPKEKNTDTEATSSQTKGLGADHVRCSGNTCTVQRSFVSDLLRDPSVLVGQGNVLPTTTSDGRSGFRISGARKGTLPRLLGLRSGDVLVSVGGEDATIDKLLSLRASFDRLDQLELTVLRGDEPVDLTLVFEG